MTYSAAELANSGIIEPPSGSDNPITRYFHIIKLIHSGKLKAEKVGFRGAYVITEENINEYLRNLVFGDKMQ